MDSHSEPSRDFQHVGKFAELLNHLFETRFGPSGRPYTLSEVSKGTGLSVPYISTLRKGAIKAVPLEKAKALARFFKVSVEYFTQDGPPEDTANDLLRDVLSKPLVLEVALRAGKVSVRERALILQMFEHAERIMHEVALPPGNPPTEHPMPSSEDTSSEQRS